MSCRSCCYYYSLELSQTSPTGDTCSQRTALEMGRPRWRESWYSSGCWRNAWSVRILIANFILRPVNPSAEPVGMENVIISFIVKKSLGRLLYNCKPSFKLFIYLKTPNSNFSLYSHLICFVIVISTVVVLVLLCCLLFLFPLCLCFISK